MSYTIYRRHYCGAKHRTYRTLAQCIWKRAVWIDGEGPYALLARCRRLTVTLHETAEAAEESKEQIDATGCGGGCHKDHMIVQLVEPARATEWEG
jgi:hypothetical protein